MYARKIEASPFKSEMTDSSGLCYVLMKTKVIGSLNSTIEISQKKNLMTGNVRITFERMRHFQSTSIRMKFSSTVIMMNVLHSSAV